MTRPARRSGLPSAPRRWPSQRSQRLQRLQRSQRCQRCQRCATFVTLTLTLAPTLTLALFLTLTLTLTLTKGCARVAERPRLVIGWYRPAVYLFKYFQFSFICFLHLFPFVYVR